MMSLVLTIFLVNLAIYLVNTIGATTFDNLVCSSNPVLQLFILSFLSHLFSHPSSPPPCSPSSAHQLMNPFNEKQIWILYLKLPTSTARKGRDLQTKKREVLQLKREMNNTSSQDEFAKWAKLRRRHDKSMEEYDTLSTFPLLSSISIYPVLAVC